MSEQVTRHRGGGRDANGKLVDATPTPLTAIVVEPRGGSETAERGRDSERTECTVYFELGTDLKNDDELEVRGEQYSIVVNSWDDDGSGVLEVLCGRGQG